jgi:hypothetical protein
MTNRTLRLDQSFTSALKTIQDNKDNQRGSDYIPYAKQIKDTLSWGDFEKLYGRTKRVMSVLTQGDSRPICSEELNERFSLFDFIIENRLMTLGHVAQMLKEQVTELHKMAEKSPCEIRQKNLFGTASATMFYTSTLHPEYINFRKDIFLDRLKGNNRYASFDMATALYEPECYIKEFKGKRSDNIIHDIKNKGAKLLADSVGHTEDPDYSILYAVQAINILSCGKKTKNRMLDYLENNLTPHSAQYVSAEIQNLIAQKIIRSPRADILIQKLSYD